MGFSPEIAAIRFGEGLAPQFEPPTSVADVLEQLQGTDAVASRFPIPIIPDFLPEMAETERLRRVWRKAAGKEDEADHRALYRKAQRKMATDQLGHAKNFFARALYGDTPFRERLTRFWGDHFTVVGNPVVLRRLVPHYMEEAIRPHVAGKFSDMLRAVITHPMMLIYLDQSGSFGPNSPAARGKRGLNENLARELLELHTMGAGAAYQQADVRQLAELLTGLTASVRSGFTFRKNMAEPDAETVLGKVYGGGEPRLEDIFAALDDLAVHPDTAVHLARKVAVHFTSDDPDEGMVQDMTAAYLASDGALMSLYEVMLAHSETWSSFGRKVKQPIDFIISSLRALDVPERSFKKLKNNQLNALIRTPLAAMGQPLFRPLGPDGWEEEATHWVTPQGLAARLQWAMGAPSAIYRSLPDPRKFVTDALGGIADDRLLFAAKNAETRREGVGLVLASPGFQRR